MPKLYENEIVYNYSPAHTINWLLRKYPNPFATHVFSVDTIERTVDPDTGIMRSERVIGVQQGAPKWITKLFALPPTAYVREVVFVDPSQPSATCMSMNLSLAQYVSCLELITYTPAPSTAMPRSARVVTASPAAVPDTDTDAEVVTRFHQRALMVSGFPTAMIARRIEKASAERFASNAGIGRKGFEWVLAQGRAAARTLGRPV